MSLERQIAHTLPWTFCVVFCARLPAVVCPEEP